MPIKINPRFEYKKLSRIDGANRLYETPDGSRVPSVTTVLDKTKSEEKRQALANWRRRVGESQATAITTEAAGRGTRMHKWLENYLLTGAIGEPGSNPYSQQSHQMARTIIDQGLINCDEIWGTEVQVYYPGLYAGTTDLTGMHAGAEAIMDHKQTNRLKKREWIEDYFIQTTAYAMAHNEIWGTNIRKGVIFMCSADNIYQEFVIEGTEFDHYSDLWLRRLEAYYKLQ